MMATPYGNSLYFQVLAWRRALAEAPDACELRAMVETTALADALPTLDSGRGRPAGGGCGPLGVRTNVLDLITSSGRNRRRTDRRGSDGRRLAQKRPQSYNRIRWR